MLSTVTNIKNMNSYCCDAITEVISPVIPVAVDKKFMNGFRQWQGRFSNITHILASKFIMYCAYNDGGEFGPEKFQIATQAGRNITITDYIVPDEGGDQQIYKLNSIDGIDWVDEGIGQVFDKNGNEIWDDYYRPLPFMVLPNKAMNGTERV